MKNQSGGGKQDEIQVFNCILDWTNKSLRKYGSTQRAFIYTISKTFLHSYCVCHRHATGRKYLDPCLHGLIYLFQQVFKSLLGKLRFCLLTSEIPSALAACICVLGGEAREEGAELMCTFTYRQMAHPLVLDLGQSLSLPSIPIPRLDGATSCNCQEIKQDDIFHLASATQMSNVLCCETSGL